MPPNSSNSARTRSGNTNAGPKYPSQEEWEKHRALIAALYEQTTLKRVMEIMSERYNFNATVKMYKGRIVKWGLDKNRKEDEMRAIVVKAHERRDKGAPIFYIRGKEFPYESAVAYFKRRQIDLEDVVAEGMDAPTPPAIRCVTPPPRDSSSFSSPLISTVSTPTAIAIPEQSIRWIKAYVAGSFDAGTWLSASDTEFAFSTKAADKNERALLTGKMDQLHNQTTIACALFSKLRFTEAGDLLTTATEGIKELTKREYPPLLDRLPRTLLTLIDKGHPQVAKLILRQFAEFAKIYHGSTHPLYQFCWLLSSLSPEELVAAIHISSSVIRDAFTESLSPFHRTSLAARYTYVRTVLASQGIDAEAEGYSDVVRSCEANLPPGDFRTVKARTDLALFLQRKGKFTQGKLQAEKIIDETFARATSWDREKRAVMLCARGYSCRSGCEYGLGKLPDAIKQKRMAIELYKGLGDEEMAHVEEESFWLNEWIKELRKETEGTQGAVGTG